MPGPVGPVGVVSGESDGWTARLDGLNRRRSEPLGLAVGVRSSSSSGGRLLQDGTPLYQSSEGRAGIVVMMNTMMMGGSWMGKSMAVTLVGSTWCVLVVAMHSLVGNVWLAGVLVGACVAVVWEMDNRAFEQALAQREAEALNTRMQVVELKVLVRELARKNEDFSRFVSRFKMTSAGSAKF